MTMNNDFLNAVSNWDINWNALSTFSEYKVADKPSLKPARRSFSLSRHKNKYLKPYNGKNQDLDIVEDQCINNLTKPAYFSLARQYI